MYKPSTNILQKVYIQHCLQENPEKEQAYSEQVH